MILFWKRDFSESYTRALCITISGANSKISHGPRRRCGPGRPKNGVEATAERTVKTSETRPRQEKRMARRGNSREEESSFRAKQSRRGRDKQRTNSVINVITEITLRDNFLGWLEIGLELIRG